ncbi:hypothetical protein MAPG_08583 [Magnaporthiopsis poae ATCC 64411]|uniref:Uncharacterized protein n=1 Tax=Magnaporthiopsis poae (strain ATCC 64411 / 73-15) TaxID=644358 RepID=A0A0C4E7R3_MAGP6|nr:hypothetical protein MAPG_08583 [Magnaporthiopsis poae ATCC 64411]
MDDISDTTWELSTKTPNGATYVSEAIGSLGLCRSKKKKKSKLLAKAMRSATDWMVSATCGPEAGPPARPVFASGQRASGASAPTRFQWLRAETRKRNAKTTARDGNLFSPQRLPRFAVRAEPSPALKHVAFAPSALTPRQRLGTRTQGLGWSRARQSKAKKATLGCVLTRDKPSENARIGGLLISFACAARSGRARGMLPFPLFPLSRRKLEKRKTGDHNAKRLAKSFAEDGSWPRRHRSLSQPRTFSPFSKGRHGQGRQRANAGNGSGSPSTAAKSMHSPLLRPASQSAADGQHPGIPVSDRLQKPKKFPRTAAAWREVRHCAVHTPKKDGEQGTSHGKEKGREKRRPAAQT